MGIEIPSPRSTAALVVRDLGVFFDTELSMKQRTAKVSGSRPPASIVSSGVFMIWRVCGARAYNGGLGAELMVMESREAETVFLLLGDQ